MANGFTHHYHMDESISNLRVLVNFLGSMFQFHLILKVHFLSKLGDSDQTPQSAASDLGLHCLPMSHKKGCLAYMG